MLIIMSQLWVQSGWMQRIRELKLQLGLKKFCEFITWPVFIPSRTAKRPVKTWAGLFLYDISCECILWIHRLMMNPPEPGHDAPTEFYRLRRVHVFFVWTRCSMTEGLREKMALPSSVQLLRRKLFNEDGKSDFERSHRENMEVDYIFSEDMGMWVPVSKSQRYSKDNMGIKSPKKWWNSIKGELFRIYILSLSGMS